MNFCSDKLAQDMFKLRVQDCTRLFTKVLRRNYLHTKSIVDHAKFTIHATFFKTKKYYNQQFNSTRRETYRKHYFF